VWSPLPVKRDGAPAEPGLPEWARSTVRRPPWKRFHGGLFHAPGHIGPLAGKLGTVYDGESLNRPFFVVLRFS
jgi:hypothetical protein